MCVEVLELTGGGLTPSRLTCAIPFIFSVVTERVPVTDESLFDESARATMKVIVFLEAPR